MDERKRILFVRITIVRCIWWHSLYCWPLHQHGRNFNINEFITFAYLVILLCNFSKRQFLVYPSTNASCLWKTLYIFLWKSFFIRHRDTITMFKRFCMGFANHVYSSSNIGLNMHPYPGKGDILRVKYHWMEVKQ